MDENNQQNNSPARSELQAEVDKFYTPGTGENTAYLKRDPEASARLESILKQLHPEPHAMDEENIATEELKQRWGGDYQANIGKLGAVGHALFGSNDEITARLESLGNEPDVLEFLASMHEQLSQPPPPPTRTIASLNQDEKEQVARAALQFFLAKLPPDNGKLFRKLTEAIGQDQIAESWLVSVGLRFFHQSL